MAELVLNLDEVGISDWEDGKKKKVIVTAAMRDQRIYHGVSWNVEHISVIACKGARHKFCTTYNSGLPGP
jgi:hypothetical protein